MAKSLRKLLISYIVVMFLTIAACISATYAWVAANRRTDSKGARLLIQTVSDITNISCYVLKYDGIEQASVTLIEPNVSYQITMSEFDMIFRDRNINTPLIIRLIVSDLPSDVRTNTKGKITISIPCSSDYKNEHGQIIGSLSNVITLRCGCGLTSEKTVDSYGSTIESNEKVAIFRGAIESVQGENASDYDEYVTGSSSERTKKDMINLTLGFNDYVSHIQRIEYDGFEQDAIVLYIEFNYVTTLVEEYVNSYGGYAPTNDFISDIGIIYIDLEKGE